MLDSGGRIVNGRNGYWLIYAVVALTAALSLIFYAFLDIMYGLDVVFPISYYLFPIISFIVSVLVVGLRRRDSEPNRTELYMMTAAICGSAVTLMAINGTL